MANFCTKCGKPIAECICNQQVPVNFPPISDPAPPVGNQTGGSNTANAGNPVNGGNPASGGKAITIDTDAIKDAVKKTGVSFKEYMGLDEAEQTDDSDPYERGLKIVPDIVAPCEGEVPIKQYDVGKFRSFFSLKWAEARIQITNKRVIFRCSGRSPFGKDFTQSEHAIDELIGLNYSKGVRLSPLTLFIMFLINTVIIGITLALQYGLGDLMKGSNIIPSIIGLIGFAGSIAGAALLKKKYFYNSMISAAALGLNAGAIAGAIDFFRNTNDFFLGLSSVLSFFCFILSLFFWIKVSLKPSASITFTTKNASKDIMGMFSPRIAKANISAEVLPAKDTELAFAEISAIISDVQKLGDYAIQKWQVK